MGSQRPLVVLSAAALASALTPAVASAASISTVKPCYVNANPLKGSPVLITGSGFTAGDTIELQATGVFGTTTADAGGNIRTVLTGPILSTPFPAVGRVTVTATDQTTGTREATARLTVTNLSFRLIPSAAAPSKHVRYTFSGFRPGKQIFGHYLHNGQVSATVRFGRASGPCGTLKTRNRFFPENNPRFNKYTLQFDDSRRYAKHALPRILTSLGFIRI